MPTFAKSVLINAPVRVVFGFHERQDALPLLAPRFPPLRMINKTGGIEAGARVQLRMGFVSWVAVHTEYERDRLFVDEQVQGPFAQWIHRHEFEEVAGKTRLTDRVTYRLYGGEAVNRLLSGIVNLGLERMFARRHRITKRICETA